MPTFIVINGIRIEMRPREKGHNVPHVHAIKDGQSISISFSGDIIAGKLKSAKDELLAAQWVVKNKRMLEEKWKEMH